MPAGGLPHAEIGGNRGGVFGGGADRNERALPGKPGEKTEIKMKRLLPGAPIAGMAIFTRHNPPAPDRRASVLSRLQRRIRCESDRAQLTHRAGRSGAAYFSKTTSITIIVPLNSGVTPGDLAVQGQVSSIVLDPAKFGLIGCVPTVFGLLRRLPRGMEMSTVWGS